MKSKTCEQVQRMASARQDGATVDTHFLDTHITHCSACRRFIATLTWIETEMQQTIPSPPPGIAQRLLAETRINRPQRTNVPLAGWLSLPVAACSVVGMLAIGSHRKELSSSVPSPSFSSVIVQPHARRTQTLPVPVRTSAKTTEAAPYPGEKRSHQVVRPFTPRKRYAQERTRRHAAISVDDLTLINAGPIAALNAWSRIDNAHNQQAEFESRLRAIAAKGDEFVAVPFPQVASLNDPGALAAAETHYRKETAIVDPRLQRTLTLAFSEAPFSKVCEELTAKTGISFTADVSIADDNLILYCQNRSMRDIMRQISRHFGFTWHRESAPSGEREYRYILAQELPAQLMEEELRNRDRNQAILGINREMNRYRPYLRLSHEEILKRAVENREGYLKLATRINGMNDKHESVPNELHDQWQQAMNDTTSDGEFGLLEKLYRSGWAPVRAYFNLTAEQRETLLRGEVLTFSSVPSAGEEPWPIASERDFRQSLGDWRITYGQGGSLVVSQDPFGGDLEHRVQEAMATNRGVIYPKLSYPLETDGNTKYSLLTLPTGRSYVACQLQLQQKELGVFELRGTSGWGFITDGKPGGTYATTQTIATGTGPGAQSENPIAVQKVARQLTAIIGNSPKPVLAFGPIIAAHNAFARVDKAGEMSQGTYPKIAERDILQSIHRTAKLDIISDGYYRLADESDLKVAPNATMEEVLQKVAKALKIRWQIMSGEMGNSWLCARSRTFYNDRATMIPGRLFSRWQQRRQERGFLSPGDLQEIAQLSDARLDSGLNCDAAIGLYGLREWRFVQERSYRKFLRFYQHLSETQQKELWTDTGLPFVELSAIQQEMLLHTMHGNGNLPVSQRDLYRTTGRLQGRYVTFSEAEKATNDKSVQPDIHLSFRYGTPNGANGFSTLLGDNSITFGATGQ